MRVCMLVYMYARVSAVCVRARGRVYVRAPVRVCKRNARAVGACVFLLYILVFYTLF